MKVKWGSVSEIGMGKKFSFLFERNKGKAERNNNYSSQSNGAVKEIKLSLNEVLYLTVIQGARKKGRCANTLWRSSRKC